MSSISKNIFRMYDIRGQYGGDLDDTVAKEIGCAVGTFLIRNKSIALPKIIVGKDNRDSSSAVCLSFIEGLVETGCSVDLTGFSLTPIIHYAMCNADYDLGVEITASHNPNSYNGFRLDYRNAKSLYGDDIQTLAQIVSSRDYVQGNGRLCEIDFFPTYLAYLKDMFRFTNSTKVLVDCGFGTISHFIKQIFDTLGVSYTLANCVSDGSYPKGVPDPENADFMQQVAKEALEGNFDVAFVFDPDSDRFGFVDNKGTVRTNEEIFLLFAKDILQKEKGGTYVYDVKCSNRVKTLLTAWGGQPKMIRTGHSFFVEELHQGAVLGGEFSGHLYFSENFGYDDGIFAACKTLELLQTSPAPLSELFEFLPNRCSTPELKVDCADERKGEIVAELTHKLISQKEMFHEVSTLDGVRVSVSETGWFLIRASNTSPYLSVRIEGADTKERSLLVHGVLKLLSPHKLSLESFDSYL